MSKSKRFDWENYLNTEKGEDQFIMGMGNECEMVIIACALIDHALLSLIDAKLLNCDKKVLASALGIDGNLNAPMSNFSAKIKMCYLLGIITKKEYLVIDNLRKIRNEYAHNVEADLYSNVMKPFLNEIIDNFENGLLNSTGKSELKEEMKKVPSLVKTFMNSIVCTYTQVFKKRISTIERISEIK